MLLLFLLQPISHDTPSVKASMMKSPRASHWRSVYVSSASSHHVITGRTQGAAAEEDMVGKQQLKRTQSGSSSWSGQNQVAASWRRHSRGTAAKADTIGMQFSLTTW